MLGILLSVSRGWCAEPPAGTFAFSINEAIQQAFANNKELQIAAKEVDIGRAQILGARSQLLPQARANAGYGYNSYVLNLGATSGAKKDSRILTGYVDDNTAGVSVDQVLYNGGANTTQLKQAKVNLKIQEQTLRARKQDLAFEVKRLYFGLLLALETERISQNLVNLAQSHYTDVQKKFDAGTVSKFDLLQSKVQVSKLTPELIRAQNAVELIVAEFKKVLGLGMDDKVSLKDKLVYSLGAVNEKETLKVALLSNPQMALQILGVDISQLGIDLAKAGNRPQVSTGAGTNFRSNDVGDMFNNRHNSWNANITVSLPVFDGFSSKAKVDEAKARYSQRLLSKEDLAEQIAVSVKQAALDLKKAEALINSQKDNIEQAKEALRIAQVRYDNGEGTNLDVLEAQVSLSQIEKFYSDGIFDYIMAQAYLGKILGSDVAVTAQQ